MTNDDLRRRSDDWFEDIDAHIAKIEGENLALRESNSTLQAENEKFLVDVNFLRERNLKLEERNRELEHEMKGAFFVRKVVGTDIDLPIHFSQYVPALEEELSRRSAEVERLTRVVEAARILRDVPKLTEAHYAAEENLASELAKLAVDSPLPRNQTEVSE